MTANFEIIVNESLYDPNRPKTTLNVVPRNLQEKLRKKQLPFVKSEAYLKRLKEKKSHEDSTASGVTKGEEGVSTQVDDGNAVGKVDDNGGEERGVGEAGNCSQEAAEGSMSESVRVQTCGALTDEDVIKLKPDEKKKVQVECTCIYLPYC